jgi:catechol 2,3-dioxygenase-like lactoylglutathione lyase family enzyme
MEMKINSINHVCLVVKDQAVSESFYVEVLGLKRHHRVQSWFHLNDTSALHLVEIPEVAVDGSLYHEVQHFALEVPDLRAVQHLLLSKKQKPFQMDFEGKTKAVSSVEDRLDFGIGTLFVYDPDGNLVEFVQLGSGIFREA